MHRVHNENVHGGVSAERKGQKTYLKEKKKKGSTKERKHAQTALDDPGVVMENEANPMIFRCMSCSLNPTDKFHVFTRHLNFYHSKQGQNLSPKLQCTQVNGPGLFYLF